MPLVAPFVVEHFRTEYKEQSPVEQVLRGVISISFVQDDPHPVYVLVQLTKPGFQSTTVVLSVENPVVDQNQIILCKSNNK